MPTRSGSTYTVSNDASLDTFKVQPSGQTFVYEMKAQRSPVLHFGNAWFRTSVTRLYQFLDLPENWNSYGSYQMSQNAIEIAIQVLDDLSHRDLPNINIVPVASGGVQFEWDNADTEVELYIRPDGVVQHFRFFANGEVDETAFNAYDPSWLPRAAGLLTP